MSGLKTMFEAATFASLIAAPAFALEITADAMLGAAPEDMTTITMMEDSAFVGNEVRTKDQVVIGLVKGVYMSDDNTPMALVALNSDIGAKSSVKDFTLSLPVDQNADGALTLAWTESDLFIALSGNLEGAASN